MQYGYAKQVKKINFEIRRCLSHDNKNYIFGRRYSNYNEFQFFIIILFHKHKLYVILK